MDLTLEDLITEEDVVVTLSHQGYAKSQPIDDHRAQRRGGRGKMATTTKDEDFRRQAVCRQYPRTILCFLQPRQMLLAEGVRTAAGRTQRPWPTDGQPVAAGAGRAHQCGVAGARVHEDRFVFMATASGTVKKTPLVDFSRPRTNGIIAVDSARRRPPDRGRNHRRGHRASCCSPRPARRSASGVRRAGHGPHRVRCARRQSARDSG